MQVNRDPGPRRSSPAHHDMLCDSLKTLVYKNEQCKQRAKNLIDSSITTDTVAAILTMNSGKGAEYVISLCDFWKLSDEVKFLAVEILNQFLIKLTCELYHTIWIDGIQESSNKNEEIIRFKVDKNKENKDSPDKSLKEGLWNSTIEHISKQMELRVVSSVSIASKFLSMKNYVKASMALSYLNSRGYTYNKTILQKSEIRIFKYLQFNIYTIPCVVPYISAMLQSIVDTDCSFDGNEIFPLCIDLLHCFYQRRTLIYARLWHTELSDSGMVAIKSLKFASHLLESMSDMVLLTCAVIASATYLLSKRLSDRVIVMLRKMTTIPDVDIAEFAYILMEVSLSPTPV